MTAIRIIVGDELRFGAALRLAPAVRAAVASLGPEGRTALCSMGNSVRRATTGVEIIRYFTDESAEGKLLRETVVAAERDLGDGTSRLVVMFDAALNEGTKAIARGVHPTALLRAVESLRPELDHHFTAATRPWDSPEALLRAANLPERALPPLQEALNQAGTEEHVELSASFVPGLTVEKNEGFTVEIVPVLSGTLSYMDRVYLLVANHVIHDLAGLVPVIEGFAKSDKSLVVAARAIEGPALQLLERNRAAGVLRVSVLTPRDNGPRAAEILSDLAVATGASLIAEETGLSLDRLTPKMLGQAESLRRSGDRVILTNPAGDADAVARRQREIEGEIAQHRYLALDREYAQRRHARMSGRWIELRIGRDPCCPELHERMARALASLRSARAGGWIAGAGRGLSTVADGLEAGLFDANRNSGRRPSIRPRMSTADRAARCLLARALRATETALRRNAGGNDDRRWADTLPSVADPAPLSRNLIATAVSLALHILTLEIAVSRT